MTDPIADYLTRLRKMCIRDSSYPAKVFKGTRMAGQLGNKRVTVQNLEMIKVMPEHNILVLKGSVPGAKGSIIAIEK